MTIKIIKTDPLKGCKKPAQITAQLAVMKDSSAVYHLRKEASSWLRGVCTVLNRDPKNAKAVAYIMKAVKEQSYVQDDSGTE